MKDLWDSYRYFDEINSNVFAPTSTLSMFGNLAKNIPNHQIILADFDCFLTALGKDSIKGLNTPVIADKLSAPTDQQTYDTLLIDRGQADICFPTDFRFLQHAYEKITKQPSSVYKNREFIDMFALQSWATTQNNYNPMREEYFNTSFLVTEYK